MRRGSLSLMSPVIPSMPLKCQQPVLRKLEKAVAFVESFGVFPSNNLV